MAGRGRGRGKTNLSFNVEELGFGRGDALPTSVLQPPPLFPPLSMKPSVLLSGEKYEYLAALKQEFRSTAIESPFFVKIDNRRRDVQRYSDKYQQSSNGDCDIEFKPDWSRLPAELQPKTKSTVKPKLCPRKSVKSGDITDTLKVLEEREKKGDGEEGEEEKEEDEENEDEEVVVYDEEDEEEETDYLMSYFDNGEGLDEEEDTLEEPTY